MKYVEDKEIPNSSGIMHHSEFQKGKNAARVSNHHHHRIANGKPTPSKWDDAQKWLVGLSKGGGGGGGGEKSQSKTKPRNSNADDLRLIAPVPQKEQDYSSSEKEEDQEHDVCHDFMTTTTSTSNDAETNKYVSEHTLVPVQSICFRDMGTEMTPIASQEPSRTATPIRATTPASRSPIHSGTSTPMKGQNVLEGVEGHHGSVSSRGNGNGTITRQCCGEGSEKKKIDDQARKLSPLESRAIAWDEAERAKYMARFKREEVKIQAWENHQIRKAEMEMKKMEVKAERMKALAQERFTNKLAATKRIAEEKRANAQVELKDNALKTTERVEYIRRTGHLPSSFSFNFKLPSICW